MQGKQLKVLFLGADSADYLNIMTLNGLTEISEVDLYTYPESNLVYKSKREVYQGTLRGKGFSIFFLNADEKEPSPHYLFDLLDSSFFDLIIIGDIFYYYPYYLWLNRDLRSLGSKIIILDGADSPNLFPYTGYFLKDLYLFFFPRVHKKHLYFKRELSEFTQKSRFYNLFPLFITSLIPLHNNLREISFSFPESKIIDPNNLDKQKLFMNHIVDKEVQNKMEKTSSTYLFDTEEEYYADIQRSKYGITTKRSGWDCLRHYEIAANGAVLCFRNLHLKPLSCAPHGLIPGENCLSYESYDDLMFQIKELSEDQYETLLKNSFKWIMSKTCKKITEGMLIESGVLN